MPLFSERVGELANWDQIKLLTVAVDRLKRWYRRGLICIGDAAHAMSPIGGVGVNLAVQDAVAAANILCEPLLAGAVSEADLARVQKRREFPTRMIQGGQLFIQKRVITGVLANQGEIKPPFVVKLFMRFPALRRVPARILGVGVRPEHVRTPERARVRQPA
jgi:2-polyprenyl-6-methoxyphenol hydroxylase-like FAD-dependent oxidoreductase